MHRVVVVASVALLGACGGANDQKEVRNPSASVFEEPGRLNIPGPTPGEDGTGQDEENEQQDYRDLGYTIVTAEGALRHVDIDRNKISFFVRENRGTVSEEGGTVSEEGADSAALRNAADATEQSIMQDLPNGAPIVRVKDADLSNAPYNLTGRFRLGCTGTLIGPRQILTAAHCVYNYKTNKYYKPTSLQFRRGQHGSFSAGQLMEVDRIYAPDGYTVHHRSTSDYAVVITKQAAPASVGRMVFGVSHEEVPYETSKVHINGYPAFRNLRMFHTHCLGRPHATRRLLYPCDTYGGMSGSAVYMLYPNGKRVIYGVHSGTWTNTYNRGVRITEGIFLQLREWKRNHD